ncbi:MAG TPA: SLC13 family permease, partial [Deltaproteobacteria bacterium]|nr:SLC13 family permease [Deltaproteobacteria bacterium]
MLFILTVTIALLVFEVFRIDIIAILCMLTLGWLGVIRPIEVLSGFSSNAVISMMAVMIMGQGIAKTGILDKFSRSLLRIAGSNKPKLIGLACASVGALSAFVQNAGAAALFLPTVLNISKRSRIPASELIMPIGFAAILGGCLTMVGSSPLLLLNDLLLEADLEPYGLFSITPVGIVLLGVGIGFFLLFGNMLPRTEPKDDELSEQKRLIDSWHLPFTIWHYAIPEGSPLIGKTPEQAGVWDHYTLNILGISKGKTIEYAPWRETVFSIWQELAILGDKEDIQRFASENNLVFKEKLDEFEQLNDPFSAGFAEVVIPPRSSLVGRTLRQFGLRKRFSVEPVMFFSKGEELRGNFSDREIFPGDTIIIHGLWENILLLKKNTDVVVATPFEFERKELSKSWVAVLCFMTAIGLTLAGFPISISFLSGALVMVMTGVLRIDEAYQAIEWKVIFLIAGLIPLGAAMQKTGTAAFLATEIMGIIQETQPILMLSVIAIMSSAFSLVMSNVASTIVLAPLVIGMAQIGGLDPRPLVLLVAVCANNSFILPTNQVNAMLMTPGGYRNSDYIKAGGGLTVLFLVVAVVMFSCFYL